MAGRHRHDHAYGPGFILALISCLLIASLCLVAYEAWTLS